MVVLELDRPRELRLSHKAMKRFSALTRTPLDEIGEAARRYDLVAAMAYAMLSVQDEGLTPAQVDDMLEALPPMTILRAVSDAMQEALTDTTTEGEEAASGEGPQAAAAGAGSRA